MIENIKILHVIYALSGGGAERQLQFLIKNAPQDSTHAVLCVDSCDVDLRAWGVKCFVHHRHGRFDWSLYRTCFNTISTFQPDIVHVWLPPVISIPALLMAALKNKPVIFSYRNLMRFRRTLDVVEYFVALFCATKVIANNPVIQSSWPYRLLYRLKKGCTIPNGLDFSELCHKCYFPAKTAESVRLVFVGRLVEQKNILNLIRAVALLPGDYNWILNVYGEGGQKAEAIELASSLGVMHRIVFHGFIPDIFPKIVESDLLVMPSTREGMPNVLIEGMAMSIPIVTSDIPAITSIVRKSNAVILTNPSDPQSIADGIIAFFKNPDYYINNLKIGVELASQYDVKIMSKRYHDEYQRLVQY